LRATVDAVVICDAECRIAGFNGGAEDDQLNQKLIAKLLEIAGHRFEIVSDGRAAVEAVRRHAFDVVLMDVRMPEMDGVEATCEIRRSGGAARDIPIVALTANAMAGDRESYLAAGMTDYVTKPIDPKALQQALVRARQSCRP
jgi:CheY-like chemotaxis protein